MKFTKNIVTRAWQIRHAAANKFQCKVSEISWKVCLEMSVEFFIETQEFEFENIHYAGKFASGYKFEQATGTLNGETLELKPVSYGYVKNGKMTNLETTAHGHVAFESDGKGSEWWGKKVFPYVKVIKGHTYPFKELFKDLGFSWNPAEKAWVK